MAKKSNAAKIREYLIAHPEAKPADVAKKMKTSVAYIYLIRSHMRDTEKAPMNRPSVKPMPAPIEDMVNHPAHYKTGGIETIDFIEAKNLNYRLGNVVKYVTRADHKGDRLENLKKAMWYLEREIAKSV